MEFMKKYLNKYTYLFLGLIVLASAVIFFVIPNFQTEEFDQEVIDNIIQGITTTSTTNLNNELNENNTTDEAVEVTEEDLNIPEQELSKIEKLILNNNHKQEITGFDVYMLIGSDERIGEAIETRGKVQGKRADVIILGLVNQDTNETTLLSFPRDLLIKNTCTDKYERINASYVKNNCGNSAENLAAAIYSISGLRVNHFASFDFLGFEKIIDSVGGVEICVDVTQREGFAFELQEGCQVVNGLTTLNWIVSRSTERLIGEKITDNEGSDNSEWELIPGVSDLTRIERQQYVVVQLIKELKRFGSINELNTFINALEQAFTVDENLTINKAVDLLWNLRDFDLSSVKKITTPIDYVKLEDGRQVLILSENLTDFLIKEKVIDG